MNNQQQHGVSRRAQTIVYPSGKSLDGQGNRTLISGRKNGGGRMVDTLTPEKWGRKESADWWSGQGAWGANRPCACQCRIQIPRSQRHRIRYLDSRLGRREQVVRNVS
jgi:hypothetical protein